MRISDWSSDVCSSDLHDGVEAERDHHQEQHDERAAQHAYVGDRVDWAEVVESVDVAHDAHVLAEQPARQDHEERQQDDRRSEEHTSELQSLMRISYAVFCLTTKKSNPLFEKYN